MDVSKKVQNLTPSGIRAFFELVLNMQDVISLGVGEPDFDSPWKIREQAIYALEQGLTSYTSNKGMIQLRRQVVNFLIKRFGIKYDFEKEILITVGVSQGLDLAFRAILNNRDKVLIPEPCYVSYSPIVDLAGGIPIVFSTVVKEGFKIIPKKLEQLCKKHKPKVLMINYPCNPTGASYTKKELQELAKVIKKYDLLVVSDEVYDELTYDFEHTPFSSIKGMKDRVVYLNGFSKSYAMTGFRIGWAAGNEKIISAMTKIHQYTMLCAPIVSQMSAIEALKNGMKDVQSMKREYMRRRQFVVDGLNEMGFACRMPQGAFYVFPSIKIIGENSFDFANNLLKKKKVALVPGGAFGTSLEDFVRISYASSYSDLKEALIRIKDYLNGK